MSDTIIVIDSYSNDATKNIALVNNAHFYERKFINQADQFQWALDNCPITTDWILRLDADEYLTEELVVETKHKMPSIPLDVNGIYLRRQVHFMGKWIRYGGYYPTTLLRLWRTGTASIEQKWMDEHVILETGKTVEFDYDFIDDNLNNMHWWTAKHNNYSNREAIEYLNGKYHFFDISSISMESKTQEAKKRKYKVTYYNRAPLFLRSFLYFLYRYIIKLGFLDGKRGLIWHFLQAFWYRFLVDAKIYQIERLSKEKGVTVKQIIEQDYGIQFNTK